MQIIPRSIILISFFLLAACQSTLKPFEKESENIVLNIQKDMFVASGRTHRNVPFKKGGRFDAYCRFELSALLKPVKTIALGEYKIKQMSQYFTRNEFLETPLSSHVFPRLGFFDDNNVFSVLSIRFDENASQLKKLKCVQEYQGTLFAKRLGLAQANSVLEGLASLQRH